MKESELGHYWFNDYIEKTLLAVLGWKQGSA